jgi:hypothetical protein
VAIATPANPKSTMAEPMVAAHIKRKGFLMMEDSFEREPKENANDGTKTCRRGTPVLFSIGA